ncbi:MAG: lipopolysaccharide export system permease protein [Candidatus Latescibacterota bacterium]
MNALSRYVLKEHLWPFGLGFSLIVFVLLIDVALQFMDRILSKGLAVSTALQLLVFNLAWIIALAVPMAVLMAVLMAFARLAADGEILAAKACGISFIHLLRPVLAAAAVLTLLMILFNDRVLPDWNHRARSISTSLQRTKAALVLKQKEGVFVRGLGDYNLLIRHVDEQSNKLMGITLYDAARPGPPISLHAPRGQLQLFDNGSYARLTLEEGYFHRVEHERREHALFGHFASQVLHIKDPRRAFERRHSNYRSDREMDIAAMRKRVRDKRREQEQAERSLDTTIRELITVLQAPPDTYLRNLAPPLHTADKAQSARSSFGADKSATDPLAQVALLREKVRKDLRLIDNRQAQIDEFQVEIHKKFSIPAACLVFVLVGAPLGAIIRRRGAAVSVGISLAFFWIYWMFLIGGEELADRGFIAPALAMWAPNIVFAAIGLLMLRSVTHDRSWKALLLRKH